jgi:hypothetical protein
MTPIDLKQDPAQVRIWTKKGFTRKIPIVWSFDITGYTFSAKIVLNDGVTIVPLPLTTNVPTATVTLSLDSATDTSTPAGNHTWYLQWTAPDSTVREVFVGPYVVQAAP